VPISFGQGEDEGLMVGGMKKKGERDAGNVMTWMRKKRGGGRATTTKK
jgi:hypothetical protein